MAFFIMLYSMSQLDIKKFEAMTGSVQAQLGGGGLLQGSQSASPGPEIRTGAPGIAPSLGGRDTAGPRSLARDLRPLARAAGLGLSTNGDQVTLSLPSARLQFAAGSADLTPAAQAILRKLAKVLAQRPCRVQVSGHTCDLPVSSDKYHSNWELSADRARNVAFYLIHLGAVSAENCSFMGYADTRPLQANTSARRRAGNRRVEIAMEPLEAPDDGASATDADEPDDEPDDATTPVPKIDIRPKLGPVTPHD
jgi:chemotaxis protein MotB